jgi:2-oxoglutarate dehydrogenase complex dehydrogenase (E1) component-like enzyme
MQVCDCTTPAQYFHLLRRQMHGGKDRRGVRKPLIVFTPKSMLRHPRAVSTLSDLTSGGFREVLGDMNTVNSDKVTRVLLCTGKIYWDLLAAREERKAGHIAIVRLEQLYPFPAGDLQDMLMRYPANAELVWVQEEPRNMGAWSFVAERLDGRALRYAGRPESASPATGSHKRHAQEQAEFIEDAFAANSPASRKPARAVRKRVRA